MNIIVFLVMVAWIPILLSEYSLARAVLVCVAGGLACVRRDEREFSGTDYLALAFLAWAAVCTAFSQDVTVSLLGRHNAYDHGLIMIVVFVAIYLWGKVDDEPILFAGVVLSIIGLAQWVPMPWTKPVLPFIGRSTSLIGSPVYLGNLLSVLFVLAFCKRIWPVAILIGSCLFATMCRGALVGAVVGLWAYWYLVGVGRRFTLVAVAIGLCALVLVESRRDVSISDSGRLEAWRVAIIETYNHPLVGVGPDALEQSYRREMGPDFKQESAGTTSHANAHNIFLHLSATVGIPGLILFCLWALNAFAGLVRTGKFAEAAACLAGLVAVQFNPASMCMILVVMLLSGRVHEKA